MSKQEEVKKEVKPKAKEEEKPILKLKSTKERTKDFIFEDMGTVVIAEREGFKPEDSVRIAPTDKIEDGLRVLHAVSTSKANIDRLAESLSGKFRLDGHVVKCSPERAPQVIEDYLTLVPSPEELRKKLEDLEGKVEKWKEEIRKKQ